MAGCGCGKNSNNRKDRAAAAHKKKLIERLSATTKSRADKLKKRKLIETKIKFCRVCPHASPTRTEKRQRTRVCHKAEMSVQAILNNQNFKCPIGNF